MGFDSACHPSEVGKMSTSLLGMIEPFEYSVLERWPVQDYAQYPRRLLRQHSHCTEYGPNGWMDGSALVCIGTLNYCASLLSRIAHLHLFFHQIFFFHLFIFSFTDHFPMVLWFFPVYRFRCPSARKISAFDVTRQVPNTNISQWISG